MISLLSQITWFIKTLHFNTRKSIFLRSYQVWTFKMTTYLDNVTTFFVHTHYILDILDILWRYRYNIIWIGYFLISIKEVNFHICFMMSSLFMYRHDMCFTISSLLYSLYTRNKILFLLQFTNFFHTFIHFTLSLPLSKLLKLITYNLINYILIWIFNKNFNFYYNKSITF